MTTPVKELGARSQAASRALALASTEEKNKALEICATLLVERSAELLAANAQDLSMAANQGMGPTPLDRLRLTPERIESMAAGLRKVATLPDPIGEVLDGVRRPNGLEIERVRVPLGVVAVIYENRPNVTCDAAGICIKSGNAALLRGSSTAQHSNLFIAATLQAGLAQTGLPVDSVLLVEDQSHEEAIALMQLTDFVDCLIPRGGPDLISSIRQNATVPVIIDGDGNFFTDRASEQISYRFYGFRFLTFATWCDFSRNLGKSSSLGQYV